MIIIWSGSLGSVPAGWVLCDGTNSTPDLRNRFVVAAGSTYAVGATGGSADAIVVSHTHTLTDPGHSHGISPNVANIATNSNQAPFPGANDAIQSTVKTTGITIASAGTSGTNANLPPYYALAYIMKT
jgi:microcystin-dependent protein